MTKHNKYTEEEVEKALVKAATVTGAAQILSCQRSTIYNYMEKYPALNNAISDAREQMLDVAETALMTNIKDKHPSSVFFYLKTIGKNRGYVERVENTGKDGKDIIPVLNISVRNDDTSTN
tara:strand:- start:3588 stop:3950 length:363 start_codon:yes stop_codon:yes gene_type:complete